MSTVADARSVCMVKFPVDLNLAFRQSDQQLGNFDNNKRTLPGGFCRILLHRLTNSALRKQTSVTRYECYFSGYNTWAYE